MKSASILIVSLFAMLAACGGKTKGAKSPGGEGDDPATPFGDAAVKATVSNTPGVTACGADSSTTMGAHLTAQRAVITGGDSDVGISESFMCRAQADDNWECQWSISAVYKAAAPPAEGDPCAAAAEEPCGGEGGAGYVIMFEVASDGTVATDSISCHAPG
jgi:hypothetical protein